MKSLLRVACFLAALFALPALAQERSFFHEDTDKNARQFEAYLTAQWPASGDTAKGFKTKAQAALIDEAGFLQTMPHRHGCDGTFAARFRRIR